MVELILALLLSTGVPDSQARPDERDYSVVAPLIDDDPVITRSEGFEAAHPGLMNRRLGLEARQRGEFERARTLFNRAARLGDKPSQAVYAEMLWHGEGGEDDRALAYAWMDLAAELSAPLFLLERERYWHRLDVADRTRALQEGEALYANYGNDALLEDDHARMIRARRNVTGSRLGWVGNLQVCFTPHASRGGAYECNATRRQGTDYYQDRYWKPVAYRKWQAAQNRRLWALERVDIGLLETATESSP